MSRFSIAACAVIAAVSLARCGSTDMTGSGSTGPGSDAGTGVPDAGSAPDAGTSPDAGTGDAGGGGGVDAGTGGGGVDAGTGGGGVDAGTGGGDVDAGTGGGGVDAGTGGGGVDAGTGGGGVDAGTGGGGADAGTGGSDGGTAACTQAGLPGVAARTYVIDPAGRDPVSSDADGSGTLLFAVSNGSFSTANEAPLVSPDGTTKKYLSFVKGARLHADAAGFSGAVGGFSGFFSVRHFDSDANGTGEVDYQLPSDAPSAAIAIADPRSGTLLLGKFARSGVQGDVASVRAAFVTAAPAELWSTPLASGGQIFGAGLDLASNALVITDGSARFGAGAISAQWISAAGKDLTGEFLLISGFQAGSNTWFETSALAGGGVAIRRVDSKDLFGTDLSSQYLCVIAAGGTKCEAPPEWLSSRHNVRIEPVRGAAAYAVLPDPTVVSDCKQTVELIDANGASCASMELPMAAGSCHTRPLGLGKDGTLIQPLANEAWRCGPGDRPCRATWRFWPGQFR